jgi:hypothetical protein
VVSLPAGRGSECGDRKILRRRRASVYYLQVHVQDRLNREQQEALAGIGWVDTRAKNWHSHTRDYAAATKTVNFEDYVIHAHQRA